MSTEVSTTSEVAPVKATRKRSHANDEIGSLVPDMRLIVRSVHKKAMVSTDACVTLARMGAALYEKLEAKSRTMRDRAGRDTLYDSDIIEAARFVLPPSLHARGILDFEDALEKRKARSERRREEHKQAQADKQQSLSARIRSGVVKIVEEKGAEAEAS